MASNGAVTESLPLLLSGKLALISGCDPGEEGGGLGNSNASVGENGRTDIGVESLSPIFKRLDDPMVPVELRCEESYGR